MSGPPLLVLGPGWQTASRALTAASLPAWGRELTARHPDRRLAEARQLVRAAAGQQGLSGVLYMATDEGQEDAPSLEEALAQVLYPGLGATQGCLSVEPPLPVLHVVRADIVQGYACLPLRAAAETALVGALLCVWREAQAQGRLLAVAVLSPPLAEALPELVQSLLQGPGPRRLRFLVSDIARLP